jgi:preprotein translocase subunit SecY
MTIFMSSIQSITLLGQLTLRDDIFPYLWQTKVVTAISLIGGMFVIIFLCESVTQNGIAGPSAFILVNIMTTFRNNLLAYLSEPQWSNITWQVIMLYVVAPLIYLIIIVLATVVFERSELRIPVYRVLMNNDLADVNYIAIKLNPAGTMPVMFAMIFFLLPYYLVGALLKIWQDQPVLLAIRNLFNMNDFKGIIIYLFTAALLNYCFSFITINPSELSKTFMESGDCIAGLRPGKETLKYIKKCIILCVIPSCIMQCTLVGLPLFAKAAYQSSSKAYQMPLTMIILTGLLLNVFEGIKVIRNFRDYKAFL